MFEMQNSHQSESTSGVKQARPINAVTLAAEGFTSDEVAGLVDLQDRFLNGNLSEWTVSYKQLCFARWLFEHGNING